MTLMTVTSIKTFSLVLMCFVAKIPNIFNFGFFILALIDDVGRRELDTII